MTFRFWMILSIIFGAWALSTPVSAKWHKAESDRFVVYSDSRSEDIRDVAEMLERFHRAMELESGREVPAPSPSNRLTVFMVGTSGDLLDIYGDRGAPVGGFYIPRANGSVTFVPNPKFKGNSTGRSGSRLQRRADVYLDQTFFILLHEYAHHFLISSTRHAMPRWLSEGAAEYFASARFHDDGSVDIGLPNNERAREISQAVNVPLRHLLDYQLYRDSQSNRYTNYYGRSWLLYHYLRFAPERAGQLQRYWQAVASGTDSTEAAQQIFGDLDTLEQELRDYGRQRSMAGMRFGSADISIGPVTVTELDAGHTAAMDVIMRSKRGVNSEEAQDVLADARSVAASHPGSAHALAALAEAEYDAGNDDEAIAAAQRAIAIDPTITNAYVQQGYALFRKAEEADDKEAAYAAAMKPFTALNRLESDHTQPLIYYYRSFSRRGIEPPEGAKLALERATQLAPFDKDLAIETAMMKAAEGDPVIARYLLAPVAADPHGGRRGRVAAALMNVLAQTPDGATVDLGAVRAQIEASAEQDDEEEEGDNA